MSNSSGNVEVSQSSDESIESQPPASQSSDESIESQPSDESIESQPPARQRWKKPNIVYDYEKHKIGDNKFFDVSPNIALASIIINGILLMLLPRINRNYSIGFATLVVALTIPQIVIYLGKSPNKNIILYYLSITTLFIGCGTIIAGNEISVMNSA